MGVASLTRRLRGGAPQDGVQTVQPSEGRAIWKAGAAGTVALQ